MYARARVRAPTSVPIVSIRFDSIRVKWRTETSLENRRKKLVPLAYSSFKRSLEIVRHENCIPEPTREHARRNWPTSLESNSLRGVVEEQSETEEKLAFGLSFP